MLDATETRVEHGPVDIVSFTSLSYKELQQLKLTHQFIHTSILRIGLNSAT